jgi:hypothetical protein
MINLSLTVEEASKLLGRDLCAICGQPYSARELMDIDDNGTQACTDCHRAAAKVEREGTTAERSH